MRQRFRLLGYLIGGLMSLALGFVLSTVKLVAIQRRTWIHLRPSEGPQPLHLDASVPAGWDRLVLLTASPAARAQTTLGSGLLTKTPYCGLASLAQAALSRLKSSWDAPVLPQ